MIVAYVGNFRHSWCTEIHVKASLEALGHRVVPLQEDQSSWATIPRVVKRQRCDMLLWTRTWGGDNAAADRGLQQLRDAGVPSVSFHLDRWWGLERQYQLDEEAFFRTDLVVTAERGRDEDWASKNITHRWLPPGVFHAECEPVEPDHDRFPHDVVFVGSHPYPHPGWEPARTAMLQSVEQLVGDRLGVWPQNGKPLRGRDLQTLFASATIVIGDSCLMGDVTHYWSDRIPETLGRGGFLIHPAVEGLSDWYRDGVDLVTYPLGDYGTLVNLVADFLSADRARDDIAAHGRQTVLDRDTYVHRMTTVLAWVEDLKAGRPLSMIEGFVPFASLTTPAVERELLTIPDELLATADPNDPRTLEPIILRGPADVISKAQWRSAAALGAPDVSCDDCARIGELRCAICEHELRDVLCLGDAPIANKLRASADEPVERHPLHVVQCTSCGTVQLSSRPPAETLFDGAYPYRSSQSRTMLASASRLAQYVTTALSLSRDDLVLEVGSNDGYLLKHYQRLGSRVLGYDPAREAAFDATDIGVHTIVEFFDRKAGEQLRSQAMVVHANNVLAHVDDPNDLMAGMAAALRPEGVLVIETPWLMPMIDDGAFDTIYHEHRFYWSAHALDQLFTRHDLNVVGVEQHRQLHGGTLRVFAQHWSAPQTGCIDWRYLLEQEKRAGITDGGWADRYVTIHRGQVEKLRRWWQGITPAAGYGAAAKGSVMMHVLGDGCRAPLWVVDSTLAKQGKYTPAGSLVLPPEELAARMPSDCVIFPWNFAEEIARRAAQYVEQGGRLWSLIPDVQRVA